MIEKRWYWEPVSQDGIKSSQIFFKTCPKSNHRSLYVKWNPFQNSSESLQIFGLLLHQNLSPRTFKNRPIWSHWPPETRSKAQIWLWSFAAKSDLFGTSVTRFGEISPPLWPKVNNLRQTFEGLFSVWGFTLAKKCFWTNIHCCKRQIIEKLSSHLVTLG